MTQSAVEPSPFIIRGPVLAAFRDADTLRNDARRDAAAIREQAAADAETLRQNGLARGAEQAAALLQKAAAAAAAYQQAREQELVELAFSIAFRLVRDLPRDARAVALVQTALTEHSDWSRLRLRAHSSVVPALRAALPNSGIDIRVDDALEPDDCVLLHPDGRTDLGPVQQIRALMTANTASEIGE